MPFLQDSLGILVSSNLNFHKLDMSYLVIFMVNFFNCDMLLDSYLCIMNNAGRKFLA